MEIMQVSPSRRDSYERLFHDAGPPQSLIDFAQDSAVSRRLAEERLERFIGVVYRPRTELQSHYTGASLSRQFDAFVWFDETRAVEPLAAAPAASGVPETYPFEV